MWSASAANRRTGSNGQATPDEGVSDADGVEGQDQHSLIDQADRQRGLSGRHNMEDDPSERIGVRFETDGTISSGQATYRSDTARSRARAYAGLGTASFFTSVVNTFNTMSLGVVAIPFTFAQAGGLLAGLIMLTIALATTLSLILLLECARTTNILPCNWYLVAKQAWPKPAYLFCVDLAILILTFGMATSFLIAIGDLMPPIMHTLFNFSGGGIWVDRRTWIIIIGVVVCYPLSTSRTLTALRFTNTLTFLVLAALLMITTMYVSMPSLDECQGKPLGEVCKGDTDLWTPSNIPIQLLPILIYTFCCQQNVFAVYNESNSQKLETMRDIVIVGSGLSLTMKLGVGITAYLTYGSILKENMFSNYPNSQLVGVARLCVLLKSAFSFPMQMHPCRSALASLMNQIQTDEEWSAENEAYVPSNTQVQAYTAILSAGTLLVALSVSQLGWFLAVLGFTIGPIIAYVLPGMFYWRMHPHTTLSSSGYKQIAFGLMTLGGIIIPFCLILILIRTKGSGEDHGMM